MFPNRTSLNTVKLLFLTYKLLFAEGTLIKKQNFKNGSKTLESRTNLLNWKSIFKIGNKTFKLGTKGTSVMDPYF